jgi:hypothetical protein
VLEPRLIRLERKWGINDRGKMVKFNRGACSDTIGIALALVGV